MIGVKAHLVISTLTVDIKLFMVVNDGVFISFVSNGTLQRAKTQSQSLKSTVTDFLTFSGVFNLPVFKLYGVLSLANF